MVEVAVVVVAKFLLLLCCTPLGGAEEEGAQEDLSGYQVVRVRTTEKEESNTSVIDSLERIFEAVLEDTDVLM